jgi:hypothetical protein
VAEVVGLDNTRPLEVNCNLRAYKLVTHLGVLYLEISVLDTEPRVEDSVIVKVSDVWNNLIQQLDP